MESVIGIATIPPFPSSMKCPGLRALPSTVISALFKYYHPIRLPRRPGLSDAGNRFYARL
ncbi:MAG: hypothetical protein LBV23_03750 [Deltaproteobacteria bacterium]|nr:hypothetical protein [Deltaproteobacteria bacterium]